MTQLNYDQYEAPETPAYSPTNKKRKRKDPFRDAGEDYEKNQKQSTETKKWVKDDC